ncbi:MAG: hypothetical protein CMM96_07165 [Rickettsiales bacterium]|jgi:flagellar biogenesis protein FliO|nr:hypothetical protein [Rickettsiales bacterium]|tara:strand:+ start:522 stop:902 length:381 start_codon:yes stop_codon:yes gene_type:complete
MTPEFSGPSLSQYLIVMSFVFVTLLILYFIKKNKHLITNKINSKKRLKVSDITLLGQGDRALILNIDEKDYLFISGKNSGALLTELRSVRNYQEDTFTENKPKNNQKKAFEIKSLIEKRIRNDKNI